MGSVFKKKQDRLSGTIESLRAKHQMQGFLGNCKSVFFPGAEGLVLRLVGVKLF